MSRDESTPSDRSSAAEPSLPPVTSVTPAAPVMAVTPVTPVTPVSGYGAEVDALLARGRWEAACRALRAAIGAQERRRAPAAVGEASLALGRLYLARGRVTEARRWLDYAADRAARAEDAALVGDVLRWAGIAALDDGELERSESLIRMSLAAVGAAGDIERLAAGELALARCLHWQGRGQEIAWPSMAGDDRVASESAVAGQLRLAVERLIAGDARAGHETRIASAGGASGEDALLSAHRKVKGQNGWRAIDGWRRIARLSLISGDLPRASEAVSTACRLSLALARQSAPAPVERARRSPRIASPPATTGSGSASGSQSGSSRFDAGRSALSHAWDGESRASRQSRASRSRSIQSGASHGWRSATADVRVACLLEAARFQLAIGDPAGCDTHLRAALALPRARARSLRLQLVQLERLRTHRRVDAQRRIERLAAALRHPSVPRLVRIRARYWIEPQARRSAELAAFLERYGEAALAGQPSDRKGAPMFEAFQAMLQICHDTPDDLAALARVAAFLREQLRAACVSIHGAPLTRGRLAVAGSIRLTASGDLAARAIDTGLLIPPTRQSDAIEAAVPVRYAGHTIGAVVVRWIIDAVVDQGATAAWLGAAAAAVAPQVRATLDRDPPAAGAGTSPAALHGAGPLSGLLGVSAAMVALRQLIARVALAPFHVLIEGESGSGKELVARALHQHGPRRLRRFCAINCAALTDDLLEAELFGHARGAFTGAVSERPGLFEEADGGTLFLDEIGELSARGQAKLLRVIQDGETRRIGENVPRRVDARIVAATNRSLHAESAAGAFRADLLYRLDVVRITVPPLRVRPDDVPVLARAFWDEALARTGSRATLDPDALAVLARYHWPGNVRELHNVIMALAVHAPSRGRVGPGALPAHLRSPAIARQPVAVRPMTQRGRRPPEADGAADRAIERDPDARQGAEETSAHTSMDGDANAAGSAIAAAPDEMSSRAIERELAATTAGGASSLRDAEPPAIDGAAIGGAAPGSVVKSGATGSSAARSGIGSGDAASGSDVANGPDDEHRDAMVIMSSSGAAYVTSSLDAARRAFDARFVRAALARAGGQPSRAARDLGLSRQGLRKLMMRLGLATPRPARPAPRRAAATRTRRN